MRAFTNGPPREVGTIEMSVDFFTPPPIMLSALVVLGATVDIAAYADATLYSVSYNTSF